MGLETHSLNLVRYISGRCPLGAVATIGRQELALPNSTRRRLGVRLEERYCEDLLSRLGADLVHSFDYSEYEGATYVCNLNEPYDPEQRYDTVLDFGSLEHVFNQATAFKNVMNLAKVGGIVCHALPVNNLSGHGFFQYCSDLLYELYSEANGFADTEVFYASSLDDRWWYLAPEPMGGIRVEIVSLEPIILLSWSRKVDHGGKRLDAYQRFYENMWQPSSADLAVLPKQTARASLLLKRSLRSITPLYLIIRNTALLLELMFRSSNYSLSSSKFKRIRVSDMVGRESLSK